MAQIEPMDIDSIGSEFDDKENSLQISNVLTRTPCTEKGYEELDVSEFNMKLRYSITPASSPMSRSYTANSKDNKTFNLDQDSFNNTLSNDSSNLTRSLNSTLTKFDTKSPKLPLQTLPNDQFVDNMTPIHRSLDPNITITVNGTYDIEDNLSLPSTSSSAVQTPEATTPTKDIPKDDGSPIMRGLKSVLNMFRSSQSPIPPEEIMSNNEIVVSHEEDQNSQSVLASTPKTCKNKDSNSPKRSSPLKESVVFNEDLERELQWKDDSTIIFKQEKIPIHKLFLQQSTCMALEKQIESGTENLYSTECMDVSNNDSIGTNHILTGIENKMCTNIESTSGVESEGEFLDCETTYIKNEQISEQLPSTTEFNDRLSKDNVDKQLTENNVSNISEFTELSVKPNDTKIDMMQKLPEVNMYMKDIQNINLVDNINVTVDLKTDETLNESDLLNDSNNTLNTHSSLDCNKTKLLENHSEENKSLNTSDCIINKEVNKKDTPNNSIDNNEKNVLDNCNDEDRPLNMLTSIVNEEINLEEKSNNITMPLNIETENDTDISNKNNDPINCIKTDNVQQEISLQDLNSGILQICMSKSENYNDSILNNGHEHANITSTSQNNDTEPQYNAINLEKDDTGNYNEVNEKDLPDILVAKDIHMTPIDTLKNDNAIANVTTNAQLNNFVCNEIKKCEDVINSISNEDNYFDNQIDTKDDLNLNKDILNMVNTSLTTKYTSKLQDLPIGDLPADVPLPSDDDIEKDSLTDLTCAIVTTEKLGEQDLTFQSEHKSDDFDLEQIVTDNKLFTETPSVDDMSQHDNAIKSIILEQNELKNAIDISLQEPTSVYNNKDISLKETCTIIDNKPNTQTISILSENNTILHNEEAKTAIELKCENDCQNVLPDLTSVMEMDVDIPMSDTFVQSEHRSDDFDLEQIVTDNKLFTETPSVDNMSQHDNAIKSVILEQNELKSVMDISLQKSTSVCNNKDISLKETGTIVDDKLNTQTISNVSKNNTILHNEEAITAIELKCDNECQNMLPDLTSVMEMDVDITISDKFDKENVCINDNNDHKINDNGESKEIKPFDEEIVTSTNTSPFVSINELNAPRNEIESNDRQSPLENKCNITISPPISPKLTRRGYNINFDDIEDPFATKTNIRMSPTLETSPRVLDETVNLNQKKTFLQKKTQQHRRKTQQEKPKRDITKNKFNSSYSFGTKPNSKKETEAIEANNITNLQNEEDKIVLNSTTTLTVLETDGLYHDVSKCEKSEVSAKLSDSHNDSKQSLHNEHKPSEASSYYDKQKSTSNKEFIVKSVFNLPEIDDMNFNPFVTKSKMRETPSPTPGNETMNEIERTNKEAIHKLEQHVDNLTINDALKDNITGGDNIEPSNISSETCSSKNTEKELTVVTINTEDEDTVEGPFIESEDLGDVVKVEDFGVETDMMHFEDLPADIDNDNKDDGELFIDAEAFEFLLNQNKSNVVADSGKESLFLKFDPLFAQRVSSDGVLAALNRLQKRQSTPKKSPIPAPRNIFEEDKSHASSSNIGTVTEESIDETNTALSKPMMVVNPAINSLVSPRKSTTPPRINRRSLTFTSPAMAVIDRLLSLSGNSSTLDHETTTTMPRQNREYSETDIALTQLRELLAEKEIHVYNLRSESKELKDRLATMESQVKTLEKESQERLRKISNLNECLSEKTKINKSMAVVVEEYERTIASLIAEMEQEKRRNAEERSRLISERDEQTAHLSSMEVSFNDLHSKYEKSKQIILSMKENEDTYKKSIKEFEENLLKMQNNYELLKQHATSKLNHANQELEKFNRAHESEVLKLNAMIKRKELHITSLAESLAQKTKANEELTAICDELINKVG